MKMLLPLLLLLTSFSAHAATFVSQKGGYNKWEYEYHVILPHHPLAQSENPAIRKEYQQTGVSLKFRMDMCGGKIVKDCAHNEEEARKMADQRAANLEVQMDGSLKKWYQW